MERGAGAGGWDMEREGARGGAGVGPCEGWQCSHGEGVVGDEAEPDGTSVGVCST